MSALVVACGGGCCSATCPVYERVDFVASMLLMSADMATVAGEEG